MNVQCDDVTSPGKPMLADLTFCIDRFVPELGCSSSGLVEGDASWAVVMTMLPLHFRAEERSDDIGRACTTFRDAVLLYRNILRHDDEVSTSG